VQWTGRRPQTAAPAGRPNPTQRLRVGLLGLLVIVVCGTAGYVGFGFGVLDALFQTITTVTTVGFGELHRFSGGAEIFTILLILAGVGTAAYTLGVLIETLVEGQLSDLVGRRRMEQRIKALQGHIVLCGWGRVGRAMASRVVGAGGELVIVDNAPERIATVPHLHVLGDATDDTVLRAAGIERARTLVTALNADADNLYVTLTARSLRPDLFIVARAAAPSAAPKLYQAGADRVVNPADIGGARMAALAVRPHVAEFVDVVMHDGSLEFCLEEVQVPPDSPMAGETLGGTRIHERTGTLVLAMRDEAGAFRTNPSPRDEIRANDILIVIGTDDQIEALKRSVISTERQSPRSTDMPER
jgi:voltage-gated potassium channel